MTIHLRCPVSLTHITPGDQSLAIVWPAPHRPEEQTTERLADTVSHYLQIAEYQQTHPDLGLKPVHPGMVTVHGEAGEFGWLDSVSVPAAQPDWYAALDTAPGSGGPETRGSSSRKLYVLLLRWAAEALVGRPFKDDPLWTCDLIVAMVRAGVAITQQEALGEEVLSVELQLRARLQSIHRRGLDEMQATYLQSNDHHGRTLPGQRDTVAGQGTCRAVIRGFWNGEDDPDVQTKTWQEYWHPEDRARPGARDLTVPTFERLGLYPGPRRGAAATPAVTLHAATPDELMERVHDWLEVYQDWHDDRPGQVVPPEPDAKADLGARITALLTSTGLNAEYHLESFALSTAGD